MEGLRENWLSTTYPVIVVATTSASDQIPVQTLALFKHRVVFEVTKFLRYCYSILDTNTWAESSRRRKESNPRDLTEEVKASERYLIR